MSVFVSSWVWQLSEARGNDRLVLLALADEADDDGSNAYPSLDRIARKVRCGRATATRSVRRLERFGAITVLRPDVLGRGRHNVYTVVMTTEAAKGPLAECDQSEPIPDEREGSQERDSETSEIGSKRSVLYGTGPKTHSPKEEPPYPPSPSKAKSQARPTADGLMRLRTSTPAEFAATEAKAIFEPPQHGTIPPEAVQGARAALRALKPPPPSASDEGDIAHG